MHLESANIYRRLTIVFHDVFNDDSIVINPGLTQDDRYDWDSLTHNRLLYSVEKEFGVAFSAAEVGGLKNVGDLVTLVQRKLG